MMLMTIVSSKIFTETTGALRLSTKLHLKHVEKEEKFISRDEQARTPTNE